MIWELRLDVFRLLYLYWNGVSGGNPLGRNRVGRYGHLLYLGDQNLEKNTLEKSGNPGGWVVKERSDLGGDCVWEWNDRTHPGLIHRPINASQYGCGIRMLYLIDWMTWTLVSHVISCTLYSDSKYLGWSAVLVWSIINPHSLESSILTYSWILDWPIHSI